MYSSRVVVYGDASSLTVCAYEGPDRLALIPPCDYVASWLGGPSVPLTVLEKIAVAFSQRQGLRSTQAPMWSVQITD